MNDRDVVALFYPIGRRTPPRAGHHALLDETVRWAIRHGVVQPMSAVHQSLKRTRSDIATVLAYRTEREEVAQFISDFIGWYLLLDDKMESLLMPDAGMPSLSEMFDAYLLALAQPEAADKHSSDGLLRGAAELGARLRALSAPSWRRRFLESMRTYFYCGVLEEIKHRSEGTLPSLEEYAVLRVDSSGSYPIFDLIELASGHELEPTMAQRPETLEIRRVAAVVISWANDVLSFHKERRSSQALNLPALLMHHEGISDEDALRRAVALHNREMRSYVSLREGVLEIPDIEYSTVRTWLLDLDAVMRGLLEWQLLATRYTHGRTLALHVVEHVLGEQSVAV